MSGSFPGGFHSSFYWRGGLVLYSTGLREFSLLDGAQWLLTFSILVLVVIERLQGLARKGLIPQAIVFEPAFCATASWSKKTPCLLQERSILFLNQVDDDFYQPHLVCPCAPPALWSLPKPKGRLWQCFQYFQKQLQEVPRLPDRGAELAWPVDETLVKHLSSSQSDLKVSCPAFE